MASVRLFLKILLPLLVLAGGVAAAAWFKDTKPAPIAKPIEERVWTVEAAAVHFADVQPELRLFGEVVAAREVELRALVAGPVISVWDGFVDGGTVPAGTVLVSIDPFDAQQNVAERQASLDEARARLAETRSALKAERSMAGEDKRQVEIYQRDVARRESLVGNTVSEKGLDDSRLALSASRLQLIRRGQAIDALEAGLAQQGAVIDRLAAALARAERALADTDLKAPFDGYLADTAAQPGKRLALGDRVARLIDSRALEVRFHMSDAAFGRAFVDAPAGAERRAKVIWRTGDRAQRFDAVIDRIDSEIDPASGGVTGFARLVDDGGPGFASLRPGAFVEVAVADRLYRQVSRLPESALHGADTVYAVVDGRLEARAVEVAGRDGDAVLVIGELSEGEAVVITRLTEIGPGLKVAVR